jgi:hypothetical protein
MRGRRRPVEHPKRKWGWEVKIKPNPFSSADRGRAKRRGRGAGVQAGNPKRRTIRRHVLWQLRRKAGTSNSLADRHVQGTASSCPHNEIAECIRRKAQCSRPKGVPGAAAARAAQNAADAETKNDGKKNTEEDRGRNGQINVPGRVGEDDDERRWGRFLDATRKRRTQLLSRRSWFGLGRRGWTDDRPAVSTFDMCRIRARRVVPTKISCCPLLAWSRRGGEAGGWVGPKRSGSSPPLQARTRHSNSEIRGQRDGIPASDWDGRGTESRSRVAQVRARGGIVARPSP